jgi:DNA-binding transcriptional ArsR family regulator
MEQHDDAMAPEAEEAVRRYLNFLADPSSVHDESRVAELERRLGKSGDPIEKIRLASELYRAQHVDGSEYREAFVAHARAWAEREGIVPEAFAQLGVPAEDLREAGFAVGGRAARSSQPSSGGRTRARRVNVDEIKETALRISGPFTASELRDLAGGTPATVRKALDALEEDGRIVDLGPDRNWQGRGRAPHLYRRHD